MIVDNAGVKLHVDIDGADQGAPVTVYAHGLTNTCRELAMFTPFMAGTNVRFCFRGHGHSDAPATGYGFADFASDLDAVARETGATRAVGTSLGAGAICTLLEADPARFEAMVFLLPAGLDGILKDREHFLETARLLETLTKEQAIAAIMASPKATERYTQMPWMAETAAELWKDVNPAGAAAAIREVTADRPLSDRAVLRAVKAPVLIVAREGDPIHPVAVAEAIAGELPHADLRVYPNDEALFQAVPDLLALAREVLA